MAREYKFIDHGDWQEYVYADGGRVRMGHIPESMEMELYRGYNVKSVIHQKPPTLEEVLQLAQKQQSEAE